MLTLESMPNRPCHWLMGEGPKNDILISSRVRLARNLLAFPFMSKATETQREEIQTTLRNRLEKLKEAPGHLYVEMSDTQDIDRQMLMERHLISRQLAAPDGSKGVFITEGEDISVMVNEEDHLRIQAIAPGLQIQECWQKAGMVDDELEAGLDFAFSDKLGYLTACPTNLGTGLRVSVMVHLPALQLTGKIDQIKQAAKDMRLAVRGLYGEGTEALGDFYQISNQTTLGRSEQEIIREFNDQVVPRILQAESAARELLVEENPLLIDDRIGRALGVLSHARLLTAEEALYHLSYLRLGVTLGRISGLELGAINNLFLLAQTAHLQKIRGGELDEATRKAVRAEFIRQKLSRGNL
jgi:protein arginine kinase